MGGNGGGDFFRKMVSEIHANPMRKWGEGVGLGSVNCVARLFQCKRQNLLLNNILKIYLSYNRKT